MSLQFRFDLENFRKSLASAFDSLSEEDVKACIREGVQDAFESRIRDLIRYEFTKKINDRMFKDRDELFGDAGFPAEAPKALVQTTIKDIARQYAQEVVNRSIR